MRAPNAEDAVLAWAPDSTSTAGRFRRYASHAAHPLVRATRKGFVARGAGQIRRASWGHWGSAWSVCAQRHGPRHEPTRCRWIALRSPPRNG